MISIDTVYQRVLAFANKEQRGYITPQEFNLFANQAQMEIFEQYFYDTNAARRVQGNDTVHSDIDDMLQEKMQIFEDLDDQTTIATYDTSGGAYIIPDYIYRIYRIEVGDRVCEILSAKDYRDIVNSGPLIKPSTLNRAIPPIANITGNKISVSISDDEPTQPDKVYYFKNPSVKHRASWGYVVINEKAMYDPTNSTDFELHASEETELVYKILKYAGVSMQRQDIVQVGQSMEAITKQQQPKIQ